MPVLRVPEEILNKYYELWLKGEDTHTIIAALGISEKEFNTFAPAFLNYCRHHVKHDTIALLANGKPPDITELTDARREKFLEYVSGGLSYSETANIMCIPLITITDFWFKQDPTLPQEAKYAADRLNAEIKMSLVRRAKGFESVSETVTDSKSEGGKEGLVTTSVTSKTMRIIAGDVGAQKFWLTNKLPDEFSLDGEVNRKGNKGSILEAVDDLVAGGDDQLSMEELTEKFGAEAN